MANENSRYDPELQMFAEQQPRQPDLARLRFLRWLAEHERLEHRLVGVSVGEFAVSALPEPPTAA